MVLSSLKIAVQSTVSAVFRLFSRTQLYKLNNTPLQGLYHFNTCFDVCQAESRLFYNILIRPREAYPCRIYFNMIKPVHARSVPNKLAWMFSVLSFKKKMQPFPILARYIGTGNTPFRELFQHYLLLSCKRQPVWELPFTFWRYFVCFFRIKMENQYKNALTVLF